LSQQKRQRLFRPNGSRRKQFRSSGPQMEIAGSIRVGSNDKRGEGKVNGKERGQNKWGIRGRLAREQR